MKKTGIFLFLFYSVLLGNSLPAWAIITNLNSAQTDAYLDQLGATFAFRSMEPPEMGQVFGSFLVLKLKYGCLR